MLKWTILFVFVGIGVSLGGEFENALANGRTANEGFARCGRYVQGWLKLADKETGLIPRNRKDLFWNAKDAAADNYPFMVLTTAIIDRQLFEGRMKDMLATEIRLTSRVGRLPGAYDFGKRGFRSEKANLNNIIFGASEYIKDGLLPLTEWLGESPWRERMIGILDDMWARAPVDTEFGEIVSDNVEVNGEMLQVLSRIYWMTGDKKYLDWAVRLGDYYLLSDHHPTRDLASLRLRDHGCEIVSGLCELYATVNYAMPEKKKAYEKPVHEMLDRILAIGRNEHGLFYNVIDPKAGKVKNPGVADTWGYTYNGFYTVYLIDETVAYRDAALKALSSLHDNYRNFKWERDSSDGYADSIESALNLYNRQPSESVARWLDSEIKVMWSKQKADGVVEGWHGDGNFARTTIMYCLWKTKGVTIRPWRDDVIFGAVQKGDVLHLTIKSKKQWRGKIIFDDRRHKTIMKLPLDWPRINQFPEWFTVTGNKDYELEDGPSGLKRSYTGKQLHKGVDFHIEPGKMKRITIR